MAALSFIYSFIYRYNQTSTERGDKQVDKRTHMRVSFNVTIIQIEQTDEQVRLADSLPVLPLRDIVIFPFMIVPLFTV